MPHVILLHSVGPTQSVAERLRDALFFIDPGIDVQLVTAEDPASDQRQALFRASSVALILIDSASLSHVTNESIGQVLSDTWDSIIDFLLSSHMHVVPVLTQGLQWIDLNGRPSWAGALLRCAPIELRHVKWNDDVSRIVDRLEWHVSDPMVRFPSAVPMSARWYLPSSWTSALARFRQWRRRAIPRSRYWRRISRILTFVGAIALALPFWAGYYYWDHRADRDVMALAGRLSYGRPVEETTAVIQELGSISRRVHVERVDDYVAFVLRTFTLSGPSTDSSGRTVRQHAILALKDVRRGELSGEFADGVLKSAHLSGVDLSGAVLRKVSFADASLEGVRFTKSDLSNASLSGAFVRNANFHEAILVGADVTELDWYNALGFSENQLQSATRSGVRKCPSDPSGSHSIEAFYKDGAKDYQEEWETLTEAESEQLKVIWTEYARPDGLCGRVDRW